MSRPASDAAARPPAFLGGDGLVTLLLANIVLVATLGLSLVLSLHDVRRLARRAASRPPPPAPAVPGSPPAIDGSAAGKLVMVLGCRLRRGRVGPEFAARLRRAAALHADDPGRSILVVGGAPGGGISEAAAGARFLRGLGIPDGAIRLEEASRHTLENLANARAALAGLAGNGGSGGGSGPVPFLLVTSRVHLARSVVFAEGLGLSPLPLAAEERLSPGLGTLACLAREAYFLHWYRVGRTWTRWSRNRRSLARIS